MKLIVKKVAEGIFDFCESSNGILYDGIIYGGTEVNLSYANDALKVAVTTGEVGVYDLTDLNYDDGTEIIGFASMNEFIIDLKTAGFTGNFNSPQAGGVKEAYIVINNSNIISQIGNFDAEFELINQSVGYEKLKLIGTDLPSGYEFQMTEITNNNGTDKLYITNIELNENTIDFYTREMFFADGSLSFGLVDDKLSCTIKIIKK